MQDDILGAHAGDPVAAHKGRAMNADEAVVSQLALDRPDRAAVDDRSFVGANLDIVSGGADPVDLPRQKRDLSGRLPRGHPGSQERDDGCDGCEWRNPAPDLELQLLSADAEEQAEQDGKAARRNQ